MTNAENQFYARLTDFVYEDELAEVGPPRLVGKPVSDADHVKAYQNILYPTKEAAIQSFFDEITRFSEGSPDHVRSFVLNHWPNEETVCKVEIEADGNVWCFKRVAKLSSEGTELLNLDEDFGLWIGRREIFDMAAVIDDHAPDRPHP